MEILYADDLAITAESLVELKERYLIWKNKIESKGLKVNIRKTKIIKCYKNKGPVFRPGKHLRDVCKNGVSRNCHNCLHPPEREKEAHKFKLGQVD